MPVEILVLTLFRAVRVPYFASSFEWKEAIAKKLTPDQSNIN